MENPWKSKVACAVTDGEFVIALVREPEMGQIITISILAGGHKYFDSSVKSANGRLRIEFDEQIKKYKELQFPIV